MKISLCGIVEIYIEKGKSIFTIYICSLSFKILLFLNLLGAQLRLPCKNCTFANTIALKICIDTKNKLHVDWVKIFGTFLHDPGYFFAGYVFSNIVENHM